MRFLQQLDVHAHINPSIPSDELRQLDATIFGMTRSLDEAEEVLRRNDSNVLWGVGCHPGLAKVQKGFDAQKFSRTIDKTALVGEIGLDGKSRVALDLQLKNLVSILSTLQQKPRIVSMHSSSATEKLIQALKENPSKGIILHWWLGDRNLTQRALSLGCYFSLNNSSLRYTELIKDIPINRILTETDHPFGDRWAPAPQRPGSVSDVEAGLARLHGLEIGEVRRQVWTNFGSLVKETNTYQLLPQSIRAALAAAI